MDVSFPARIVVDEETDLDGVPIITATVTPAETSADLLLPAGPSGPEGLRGRPHTTFVKQGAIANEAARPTGLGAEDRGKWWHRLDTNGMDVWTGTQWQHSPGAVGEQGPIGPANVVTVTATTHDPKITVAAVKFTGSGSDQKLSVTVPAGPRGPAGPSGSSGAISTATDFDNTAGPTQRSMFGLNAGASRWRVMPPPNGFGPWSWYDTDFTANQSGAVDQLVVGTFTISALPFRWRPMVWGQLSMACTTVASDYVTGYARLGSSSGVTLAAGSLTRTSSGVYHYIPMNPSYGDEGTKPLSPSSTYATVEPNTVATLVVTVDRIGSGATIGYQQSKASIVVWAMPA